MKATLVYFSVFVLFIGSLIIFRNRTLDGKIVKDSNGNFYKLESVIGTSYNLKKIDTAEINIIIK